MPTPDAAVDEIPVGAEAATMPTPDVAVDEPAVGAEAGAISSSLSLSSLEEDGR